MLYCRYESSTSVVSPSFTLGQYHGISQLTKYSCSYYCGALADSFDWDLTVASKGPQPGRTEIAGPARQDHLLRCGRNPDTIHPSRRKQNGPSLAFSIPTGWHIQR